MSFQVLFHERDLAGFCAECNLRLRTDKTVGRRTPEYYTEFTRQVEASYPDRIQGIFLKTNSVSEAKRVYPGGSSTWIQNEQSSPMLHARLVMVETTRDQAVSLIEKLREQGMQVALQDDLHSPPP
jgi:hypothetical protein